MAGPILLDRVKETCTVTGLADVTLTGVVTDFKPFLQAGLLVAGDTFHYLIGPTFNEWEVGLGTLIDATSFARTTVYSSSNADNSKVSFTAGTKYAALIADAAVLTEMLNGLIPVARLPIIPLNKGGTNVDLSAGGGSGFVLKQAAGGLITSAALIASDIPALPYLSSLPVHTHLDNAGGGLLTGPAIGSGDIAAARINTALTTPGAIGSTTPSTGRFTQVGIGIAPVSGDMLSITPAAIANIGIHITGMSGQTGSLGFFQNVDNTARMEITAALGISSRLASASTGVVAGRVFGDTQPRINLTANGDFVWTDGTNAEDLRLAREGAGILSTTSVVAATAAVTTTHRFKVNSSGTAAAGFGGGVLLQLESSTTNSTNAAEVDWEWATATHASRAGRLSLHAFSLATKQEGMRIDGDAGGVKLSFYGGASVARQTITGSRGGNAALADLLTKLAATGIIIDGTTA
jgi:hypothetical protein